MFRLTSLLRIVLALGAVAVPANAASHPDMEAHARQIISDPPAPDQAYDLKARLGPEDLLQLSHAVNLQVLKDANVAPGEPVTACIFSAPLTLFNAAVGLALASGSREIWVANRLKGEEAVARARATPPRAIRTTEDPPGSDPRSQAYAQRVTRDQASRMALGRLNNKSDWAQGLAGPAWTYVRNILVRDICAADEENTAWIKQDLETNGWPRISGTSRQADHDAWLLVQHTEDRGFQSQVLGMIEPLVASKETSPSNYAYLYDRIAVRAGRPQRYGTQFGVCSADGFMEAVNVEDPPNLDARRAALGLLPAHATRPRCPPGSTPQTRP